MIHGPKSADVGVGAVAAAHTGRLNDGLAFPVVRWEIVSFTVLASILLYGATTDLAFRSSSL